MTEPTPENQAEVVQARQDEPSDGSTFTRVFSLNQHNVPDDSPMHVANKDETVREAHRRGLRATGEVTFTTEVREYPPAVVITYTVPVEPTGAAVAVSTAPSQPPALQPDQGEVPVAEDGQDTSNPVPVAQEPAQAPEQPAPAESAGNAEQVPAEPAQGEQVNPQQ